MNLKNNFSLILFSANTSFIRKAVESGVKEIIVDMEYIDKKRRQAFADTEINCNTIEDLHNVRASTNATVICRINSCGSTTRKEIEDVVQAGADEILLPMVRTVKEVEAVLEQAKGRCGVGILIETKTAVENVKEFAKLPLSRAYVGLNDLAIERCSPNIFTAIIDGTTEYIRTFFNIPFGFGGLTLPEGGYPIPCRLFIGEMARLRCDFSFLRRTFYKDINGKDLRIEIPRIIEAFHKASLRSNEVIEQERIELENRILHWRA